MHAGTPSDELPQRPFRQQVGEELVQVGLAAVDLVEVVLEVLAEYWTRARGEVVRGECELVPAIPLGADDPHVLASKKDPQLHLSPPRR